MKPIDEELQEHFVSQLDKAIKAYELLGSAQKEYPLDDDDLKDQQVRTTCRAAIEMASHDQSPYRKDMGTMLDGKEDTDYTKTQKIVGIATALRDDWQAGYVYSVQEIVRGDLFTDYLDMAEYLLIDQKLKDPAACIAGGTLESHLRKLCLKSGILIEENDRRKPASRLNQELYKADVYGLGDQKSITAWQDIRNNADHAKYGRYTDSQVQQMIAGIRDFTVRYPA